MNIPVKKWLEPFTWPAVTSNNEAICHAKSALHKATSEGHEPARLLWENSARQDLSLKAALENRTSYPDGGGRVTERNGSMRLLKSPLLSGGGDHFFRSPSN